MSDNSILLAAAAALGRVPADMLIFMWTHVCAPVDAWSPPAVSISCCPVFDCEPILHGVVWSVFMLLVVAQLLHTVCVHP